ncbi:MacB family efflux pump subunit [Herbaspirillum sp. BH-1]|uniref:Pyoverdine export ATP-binding/permease protein PvdT n=1 Tax=Herbaspirillum frisingense TaxID=92645 RepID=A0ABU1P853_9BURK|nr:MULTISPECIES: MacB family efflux pump subunit [Herbaspirillum]MDR6582082.1 macrolide transport system ATP-binding/permease protein [Herbaspirillum frisingense]PLY59396.1 MacB family efflux pump subunit [Herbaspirillum sp. BH-1]
MTTALLQLRGLRRDFPAGDDSITVLNDVNLDIEAGELVAIVGASGSGKSTLMNILGCLDKPSAGSYLVAGRETGKLDADELAQLRREHFGFIFQRYHLLSDLDATSNVEVPSVYAGLDPAQRRQRAAQLLARLGLAERSHHKPGQLSGGQQQRVSIARALMNGGDVILADEPTGALDSHSGHEVMNILKELHAEGHTIIIVTHDMQVASNAQRIIEIKDGVIIADRRNLPAGTDATTPTDSASPSRQRSDRQQQASPWRATLDRLGEALRMSLLAMNAHRLRSFLTMLGIIIGIASVVSVVALGSGSREQILSDISAMGTNTIDIFPGTDFGDMKSAAIRTLTPADAAALAEQNFVDSVTPSVATASSARYGNISVTATINGVGEQYFRVRGLKMAQGMGFNGESIRRYAQEVVIDANTYKKLFPNGGNALGEVIFLGSVPCRVIGVTQKRENGFGNNSALNVWVPYTTAMSRVIGQRYLSGITVRVSDNVPSAAAEEGITRLMTLRHRTKDFYIFNTDSIRQTIEKATATLTLLVSMIALISLVVGGIGVMNIMLVSVTERTREIGVRMAVGARQSDIMQQFLIEAVLVCLAGGLLGVLLALSFGAIFAHFVSSFRMIYSTASIVSAFACSTLIGVVFGFLPARNAARLNPVDALARE